MVNDTIVAVSTAVANQGISIVRLSGEAAIGIADKLIDRDLFAQQANTIRFAKVVSGGKPIDEALVSVFKAPNSYTTEDVVEINCHGGYFVTSKIVDLALQAGARLAEPGEFTKRAYLGGRIDLTQAEAVMDVIEAKTEQALALAQIGLSGQTKAQIAALQETVLALVAQIEVNIDYPEYEEEHALARDVLLPELQKLLTSVQKIIAESEQLQIYKYGIKTAIVGRPNVGKSSLLNALLKEDKAIVTPIAGTTRDVVEGEVNIGGVILRLLDTAGIRATQDEIEQIGVQKTLAAIEEARLAIVVLDNSAPLTAEDREILTLTAEKKRIIVVNKKDLTAQLTFEGAEKPLVISSFDHEDIVRLKNAVLGLFVSGRLAEDDLTYIANTRQLALLRQAEAALGSAERALGKGVPLDLVSIDLRKAWESIGLILGEVAAEDLLTEMFSRFCVGK